jgi:tight adherence protein B
MTAALCLVAAGAAGLTGWLLFPSSPTAPTVRRDGHAGVALRGGPGMTVALAGVAAVLLVLLDGTRLALGLVLLGGTTAAVSLVRRARVSARATARRSAVVEVCEALVGELRAGQPNVASLEHVPAALRRLARAPGAEGLAELASAWQVSERSGAGLAAALSQVARTARARQATRLLVQGELASAQATARLVAILPVGSLAMSAGIGGDPWHFLLATPVGVACLGGGVLCAFAGLLWIDRIAAGVLSS